MSPRRPHLLGWLVCLFGVLAIAPAGCAEDLPPQGSPLIATSADETAPAKPTDDTDDTGRVGDDTDRLGTLDRNTRRLIARAVRQAQRGSRLLDGLVQEAAGLDDDELRRCGRLIRDFYAEEGALIERGPYAERADRLARPVIAKARRGFDYQVRPVASDTLNAFATAGGFIYLHTALMDRLDDAQLTFVIGHEVAHVELGHTDSPWTYAERLGLLTGDNVSLVVMTILSQHVGVGYSEDQEFEADAWGFVETRDLGVTAADAIGTFELLARAANESLAPADEPETVFEELETQLANHYRTHPPSRERIEQIRDLAVPQPD
ncbi:MAG: M48 family metallopeptidase [Planctomycetota bacterium]